MRTLAVAVTVTAALTLFPGTAGAATAPNPGSVIGDTFELKHVETAADKILAGPATGVSIAIVKPGPTGSRTTTYYFGEYQPGKQVGPDTQFEIGSETKVFTGALLELAVRNGLVSLDDPVSTFIPAPHHAPTFPGARAMTLRDLATHRSGLPDIPPGYNPKDEYTVEKLWEGLDNETLPTAPGATWLYSDWGFGLLGTILAEIFVPGQPEPQFAQAVRENLTGPLGMSATQIEEKTENLAIPYLEIDKSTDYWFNTAAMAGGGGLISNADDMATWAATTMGIGNSPLAQTLPNTLFPIADGKADTNMQMGMAWQLFSSPYSYAYKDGATNGCTTVTYLVPESNWAVTILDNGNDAASDTVTERMGRQLMDQLSQRTGLGLGSSYTS
jgi:CubicO group peptidase (beta-lactamase class C family)